MSPLPHGYDVYKRALMNQALPAALVDMDALDANVDTLAAPARKHGKKLRLASKSIRCPAVLRHIAKRAGDVVGGLMTYTASETLFLAREGFTDLLLAYPTLHPADAELLCQANKLPGVVASAMVDCGEHLRVLELAAKAHEVTLPVCVDVDMSYRPVGKAVHLGVRRSPLRTPDDVVAMYETMKQHPHLRFHGVMGYEAQIAGVTDRSPFSPWMNAGKRLMKKLSRPNVEQVRADIAKALKQAGANITVFNGGGTGSLHWCSQESVLTEVTAGSGFFNSHLFDYYADLQLAPAAGFALQAVRQPAPDVITCHGGGYIASGEAGPDRLPVPWLPAGLRLLPMEGAGEVQTPLKVPPGTSLALGYPVLFRHAKAGELAEHFNHFLLVRGDVVEARAETYRGLGHCFLG